METEAFLSSLDDDRQRLPYQKAEIVYDVTYRFCKRFLDRRDRAIDQMIQAARFGKQYIAEARKAAADSKELEIRLTQQARERFERLLSNFQEFLREREHAVWEKASKEALFAHSLAAQDDATFETFRYYVETRPADVVANIAICLIHQASSLLDHQARRLEQALSPSAAENGGI